MSKVVFNNTGVARNLDGGRQNGKLFLRYLMTFLGDIIMMMSLKWHHQ